MHARDAPVARRAVLEAHARRVAVHVPDERLRATVDDAHGATGVQGEQRAVDLHREVLAPAERPADAGQVDAHLLGRQAEARRDLVAVDVQPLRGDVDVDAALAVGHGQARLRPEKRLVLDADLVLAAYDHLAGGVRVAVPDDDAAHDVRARILAVAVPHGRPLGVQRRHLEGARHVVDRGQRLVLDGDRAHGIARLLQRLGGDDRHGLAVVAHAVAREHGLVGELQAVGLRAGHVVVREHGVDAGQLQRRADVDRDDARVGVRAAQRRAVQHAGDVEVARVRELAGDLRDAVDALDGLADAPATSCVRAHARSSAAAVRTASRMRP